MKLPQVTFSGVLSIVAIAISIASLWLGFLNYREMNITNFTITAEPSFYSPVQLQYLGKSVGPGFEMESGPEYDPSNVIDLTKAKPSVVPSVATITFPVTVRVTNHGRRPLPLKMAYYVTSNTEDDTTSRLNALDLVEAGDAGSSKSQVPINIPAGEARAFIGLVSVSFEELLARQLQDIFEHPHTTSMGTTIDAPSLARLSFYDIASQKIRAKMKNPFPLLDSSYSSAYKVLIGIEDFTGKDATVLMHFALQSNEFWSFLTAMPSQRTGLELSQKFLSEQGLPNTKHDGPRVAMEITEYLKIVDNLIGFREKGCLDHRVPAFAAYFCRSLEDRSSVSEGKGIRKQAEH